MRLSTVLALICTALMTSAHPFSFSDSELGSFSLTDFRFACMDFRAACAPTCAWSFNLNMKGSFPGHPGFEQPVMCSGSMSVQSFNGGNCRPVSGASGEQSVAAYIADGNVLRLRYSVNDRHTLVQHHFHGHTQLYSPTSWKRQVSNFRVREYKVETLDGQIP